jgi:hypothetical protein
MTAKPFLYRFAKPCLSPNRVSPNSQYEYDEKTDMVRWLGSSEKPALVDLFTSNDYADYPTPPDPPVTKKCDIEKGEDQKDRRMWNKK